MYPINLHDSFLSDFDPSVNVALAASRYGFAGAGSAPSVHAPFCGRPVDSYEGHAAWRPAVFTSRAAAFLSAEQGRVLHDNFGSWAVLSAEQEREWDDYKGAEDRAFEQEWIGSDPARRAAL